ncbi:XRE family transcriptional regulator [Streptomyces sp. NPDC046862]|uniref:XRE family transcriptional regulator n=1 Tax=Streptomyces sp. NPDC046862 TaxID=3154603 RepID=UPI0034540F2D
MAIMGGPDPAEARTASEYVAQLRGLKEGSGLTFRQLEQRAAAQGDVLARSTLADALRRDGLPRAEVVAALVRACGAGQDVPQWLAARERLAATEREAPETGSRAAGPTGSEDSSRTSPAPAPAPAPVPAPVPSPAPSPSPSPEAGRWGRTRATASLVALASLGTVALLVVGALVLLPQGGGTADDPAKGDASGGATMNPAATPVLPGPEPGFSRIRPARAPELCLTDGAFFGDGADRSKVVAVQRPCAEAVPPRTKLLRADDGLYRIQWRHPKEGTGCLTVLGEGPYRGTLEPQNDCRAPGAAQRFRVEKAGDQGSRWRLRPAQGDGLCVTMRGNAGEVGAVAATERCAQEGGDGNGDAQVFLIGPE